MIAASSAARGPSLAPPSLAPVPPPPARRGQGEGAGGGRSPGRRGGSPPPASPGGSPPGRRPPRARARRSSGPRPGAPGSSGPPSGAGRARSGRGAGAAAGGGPARPPGPRAGARGPPRRSCGSRPRPASAAGAGRAPPGWRRPRCGRTRWPRRRRAARVPPLERERPGTEGTGRNPQGGGEVGEPGGGLIAPRPEHLGAPVVADLGGHPAEVGEGTQVAGREVGEALALEEAGAGHGGPAELDAEEVDPHLLLGPGGRPGERGPVGLGGPGPVAHHDRPRGLGTRAGRAGGTDPLEVAGQGPVGAPVAEVLELPQEHRGRQVLVVLEAGLDVAEVGVDQGGPGPPGPRGRPGIPELAPDRLAVPPQVAGGGRDRPPPFDQVA